jgi:hypothetical protein
VTSAGRRWSSRRCTGIAPVVRADGAGKVREGGGDLGADREREGRPTHGTTRASVAGERAHGSGWHSSCPLG